jgi:hypothetical protein
MDTDYSLIRITPEDVLRLKIIGDVYIGGLRFHAVGNKLFDEEKLVGKIKNNSIRWIIK